MSNPAISYKPLSLSSKHTIHVLKSGTAAYDDALEYLRENDEPRIHCRDLSSYWSRQSAGAGYLLVGVRAGKVVGVTLTKGSKLLIVCSAYHYGKQMMSAAERLVRSLGFRVIHLDAIPERKGFYDHIGYAEEKPGADWYDSIPMVKDVSKAKPLPRFPW